MPAISVIIPVYNAEKYLPQCLDSILRQDFTDYEVVLIDDGSTDGSRAICENYAENCDRIVFLHKENGGVSSARNMGLEHASGDYVSFVDADDWVEPDYFTTLMSIVRESDGSSTPDILFFGMILMENGKHEIVNQEPKSCNDRSSVEEAIFALRYGGERDVFGWTCGKIFKADIIRRHHIRFPEDIRFREDEIFTFEFCRYITSLHVISHPLYNYRITGSGLTAHGMSANDYLPSAVRLEESLTCYSNERIREHMLHSITSYRALHIYKKCRLTEIKAALRDYKQLTLRLPQPGRECPVEHLTKYLQKGFVFGFLYCLIRKL